MLSMITTRVHLCDDSKQVCNGNDAGHGHVRLVGSVDLLCCGFFPPKCSEE